ncbi:MAG: CinA family protein, partial [Eggerthellaceae bacterium]|nr:CinA family protein [Eggerthellaceae bacterium]
SSAEKLDAECRELAGRVVAEYGARGMTYPTCESLTGGLISGYITGISGSSAVLAGGLTTYMARTKAELAGVSRERLAETGPVDGVVAGQMAEGTRRECTADVGVAVTGIAGPTGAEPGKPVGTVWFGIANADGTKTECLRFEGGREEVRLQTVRHALELLLDTLPAVN